MEQSTRLTLLPNPQMSMKLNSKEAWRAKEHSLMGKRAEIHKEMSMNMGILKWIHALCVIANISAINYKKMTIFSSLEWPWEGSTKVEHGLYRKLFEKLTKTQAADWRRRKELFPRLRSQKQHTIVNSALKVCVLHHYSIVHFSAVQLSALGGISWGVRFKHNALKRGAH